ncbi:hypothetical protein GIB67_031095 [Kingdonia uniflora]|uniref:DRBM domain-containing protein n=1 Tax=Kingdonia uniflora TaxID=39325 RepID=A0A7J7LXF8_9MAGN|nr:hypothetical protein GIB67_031095 [Kingdonia uniflora]
MHKNQLQELAQRSCFNLPSYTCVREGPDHAPRFKACVNFNGEIFQSPNYCTTLRQAEHAAAEVALNSLSTKGPSRSLAAKVIDETGVYKNLIQETAHRAGLNLPCYTTVRSGPGHVPVFTSSVEVASLNFNGVPAKTKKQAEKNAALAAWSSLKQMPNSVSSETDKEPHSSEEQEQAIVVRVLSSFRPKDVKKPLRQTDQSNTRRRTLLGYEYSYQSSSPANSKYQHWRSTRRLPDFSPVYPSQPQQPQTQNHFFAPPTASKILPQTSNMSIPVQMRTLPKVQPREIQPTLLEEHLKDEEEWLNGTLYAKKILIEPNTKNENSSFVCRPKPVYQRFEPNLPRNFNTGRFTYAHNIAPAVHIRSVIPVCAAPPMRPSSSSANLPTPHVKQLSGSVSTLTKENVSTTSSKFCKLQL